MRLESERGAVLILLGLLAAVLIAFVGLGVDTSLLGATRRDTSNLAPRVAAGALNSYSTAVGTPAQRLETARVRAQDIAQTNVDIASTTAFLKGDRSTAVQELGTGATAGATGRIIPGVWHFLPTFKPPYFDATDPLKCVGSQPCPCSPPGSDPEQRWNGPCFEVIDDISLVGLPGQPAAVTAFHAEIRLREDAPLETRFMGAVGGPQELVVSANSTVAQRPQRVAFIVDLSRRSHAEYHLPYERVGVGRLSPQPQAYNAAEFAYRVTNPGACVAGEPRQPVPVFVTGTALTTAYLNTVFPCPVDTAATCNGVPVTTQALLPPTCRLAGGVTVAGVSGLFDGLYRYACSPPVYPPVRNTATQPAHLHSKADYRCITLTATENGTPSSRTYLVDLFRGSIYLPPPPGGVASTFQYAGAEPLNSMDAAVARGLEKLRQRRIDGDMFTVIGADHSVNIAERIWTLSLARDGEAKFDDARDTFNEPENINLRYRDHYFFPREDAMFDMPAAVQTAYTSLSSQPDFRFVDNDIILITSGRTECRENAGSRICEINQAAYEDSIQETVDFVNNNLLPNGMRFSVILVDPVMGPHTLLRRGRGDSANRCMTDAEARIDSTDFVRHLNAPFGSSTQDGTALGTALAPTPWDGPSQRLTSTAQYYFSNFLYTAVSNTGGTWGPTRPPCPLPPGVTCGALRQWLDTQCAALPNEGDLLRNVAGITDDNGRLTCEPSCLNRRAQMLDYIDKTFDRNPYLSVEQNAIVN